MLEMKFQVQPVTGKIHGEGGPEYVYGDSKNDHFPHMDRWVSKKVTFER